MIITVFPKTLGGVSFEKAGKFYEGWKPIFFDKTGFHPSCSPLSQNNDQRGFPFGNPKTYVFFLFFIFDTSGYLFWLFSYLYKRADYS